MFELLDSDTDTPMIDFGRDGKTLFQLPVLGGKGVPMGITSAFMVFYDQFQNGGLRDNKVVAAWNLLIQTLADTYPAATRKLATLDEANVAHVVKHWVTESEQIAGFDAPKA